MKKLTALLLLLPALAIAASNPHLKDDTPNELAYYVTAGRCPFSDDDLAEVVSDVLVRSRIKAQLLQADSKELYIYVVTNCYSQAGVASSSFHIDVGFGQRMPISGAYLPVRFLFGGYGVSGLGPREMILEDVKERTERAITEYLKVNFDLGENE